MIKVNLKKYFEKSFVTHNTRINYQHCLHTPERGIN